MTDLRTTDHSTRVTTGAGIAIAGIWLSCASLTALTALLAFLWAPDLVIGTAAQREQSHGWAFVLLFLLALTRLVAWAATLRILGKDD